ncbi:MAG: sn-glycerol-3-phosphate ABC transporter ATP-binding protein UgpC [Armatimonadota bacterium]|nr:MAG: sn-glycerol-3-phosphate ABC transporter ATP-binding protein UgpC [Armatimonadota bacterium]
MAAVKLRDLTKHFGKVVAVEELTLDIHDKEFLVLVGPSGCGKTTALRMIAGLEEATEGEIFIDDRLVNDVSPKDRDIAMVFQNYALYPHMTVYDNMAFGLKLRKVRKAEIERRVHEAAQMLGLMTLLKRRPKELSGGERQRVALGRAIVREPKVFLMDEPLSNLDAKLRVQTRAELIKLHRRLGITTIYVTHDQIEAMTMGDRIAVLKDGLMQQVDTPMQLFNHPANLFVASFIGSPAMNFIPATVVTTNGTYLVDAQDFKLKLPESHIERVRDKVGQNIIFGIRPDDIYDRSLPTPVNATEDNSIKLTVDVTEPMGASVHAYLTSGTHTLIADLDGDTEAKDGQPLDVIFDMESSHVFDPETEKALI